MNPRNKNIGELKGKVLVFGGIYSNFQALERMKEIADRLDISANNIIHTGDLIAYCASPVACTELVQSWGIHCIQGNVEENIISGSGDCGCNFVEGGRCEMLSRSWFPYTKNQVNASHIDFYKSMPHTIDFVYSGQKCHVLHGSESYISEFIFQSTPWNIKEKSFESTGAEVIIAGHCGIPFSHENEGKVWLNPGVIGVPANDGTPFVWYMLLDDSTGKMEYSFHRFEYDNFEANQLMMEASLPWTYAETIMKGIWDNTEILPQKEAQEQGIPLSHLCKEVELLSII